MRPGWEQPGGWRSARKIMSSQRPVTLVDDFVVMASRQSGGRMTEKTGSRGWTSIVGVPFCAGQPPCHHQQRSADHAVESRRVDVASLGCRGVLVLNPNSFAAAEGVRGGGLTGAAPFGARRPRVARSDRFFQRLPQLAEHETKKECPKSCPGVISRWSWPAVEPSSMSLDVVGHLPCRRGGEKVEF